MLVLLMGGIYELCRWDGFAWYDIRIEFHDDLFRHSSNIKVIVSTSYEAAMLVFWCEVFMNYAVEMTSGGMVYIPSSMKISIGIGVLVTGDTQTVRWFCNPIFVFLKIREVGWKWNALGIRIFRNLRRKSPDRDQWRGNGKKTKGHQGL
jgi:hypothetical protein